MALSVVPEFTAYPPWKYGGIAARAFDFLYRITLFGLIAALFVSLATPVHAQQANQPGFDPRQTEKRFDDLGSGRPQPAKPPLRVPSLARPEVSADTKPQFVLRAILLFGDTAMRREDLAAIWQPYLGKMVSQADLAGIAQAIGDLYRAAGFHLSRAIIPPQDIENGRVRIQVIEGSITDVALQGEGAADQFGVRPMLEPVLAERKSTRLNSSHMSISYAVFCLKKKKK